MTLAAYSRKLLTTKPHAVYAFVFASYDLTV
jgi:hypothetical protein